MSSTFAELEWVADVESGEPNQLFQDMGVQCSVYREVELARHSQRDARA